MKGPLLVLAALLRALFRCAGRGGAAVSRTNAGRLAWAAPLAVALGAIWLASAGPGGGQAAAATGSYTAYPIPTGGSMPTSITKGADGNLWFAENAAGKIGRITPAGVITEFARLKGGSPVVVTPGPDGNVWFSDQMKPGGVQDFVGKITPTGVITEYPVSGADGVGPVGITTGPDGNIWYAAVQGGYIGRLVPDLLPDASGYTKYPLPGAGQASNLQPFPQLIVVGGDGNLWFSQLGGGGKVIGRITPAGKLSEFALPVHPDQIAPGPDGNVWFASSGVGLGKITPAGEVVTYTVQGATRGFGQALTVGPDGNLWVTDRQALVRVTPAGEATIFPLADAGSVLASIATGPDGNLWFVEQDTNRIGRFTLPPTPRDFLPVAFFDFSPGP